MITKMSLKKVLIGLFCLLVLFILYLFPKNVNSKRLNVPTTYKVSSMNDCIYLLDKNNYVSRVSISIGESDIREKALKVISYLTIGSSVSNLLPNGFSPIIPKDAKVLAYELDGHTFKVNFSKEFLDVSEDLEVKLIEALVYSITGINGINKLVLLVEGDILNRLPQSNIFIDSPLDRSFGINKTYDLYSLKGSTKTTLYYISKYDGLYYYVPVTKVTNDSKEKIEVIIEELSSSNIYETSLMSYLNSEAILKNYELLDKNISLDFNNAILSDLNGSDILEEVTYAINLSIKDNYDVETVSYSVDNKEIVTFDLKSLE